MGSWAAPVDSVHTLPPPPAWGVDARPHFTRVEVDCKEQHCTPQAQLYLLLHQVAGVGQLPGNVGQHLVTLAPARAPCDGYASLNGLAHRAGTTCWVPMQQRQARNMAAAVHKTCHAWQPTPTPGAPQHVEEAQHGAPPLLLLSRLQQPPAAGALQPHAAARGWHPAARLQGLGNQGSRAPQDR